MIGIYHDKDLDGICSGAIIKMKYPDATMIGYDYGRPIPRIPEGEPVIMSDVSLPMKDMHAIAVQSRMQFTWIDHHKSAIKDYVEFTKTTGQFLNAFIQEGLAACELTWMHLFPQDKIPWAVELLGKYDTWRQDSYWKEETLPFQYGMRSVCNSLDTFPFEDFNRWSYMEKLVEWGQKISDYTIKLNESQCRAASFEVVFEGLRAVCLNGGGFNSQVFDSVYDESKHDLMMPFQFNGRHWTVSIYTTKDEVDCSVIAKKYGGGGHAKAAGFKVQDLKELLTNQI